MLKNIYRWIMLKNSDFWQRNPFAGITRLPILEGEVSHVEIPRTRWLDFTFWNWIELWCGDDKAREVRAPCGLGSPSKDLYGDFLKATLIMIVMLKMWIIMKMLLSSSLGITIVGGSDTPLRCVVVQEVSFYLYLLTISFILTLFFCSQFSVYWFTICCSASQFVSQFRICVPNSHSLLFAGVPRGSGGNRWSFAAGRSDHWDQRSRYDLCHPCTGILWFLVGGGLGGGGLGG